MTFRPALTSELKKWNRWLQQSHALKRLPNRIVYYCDFEFPMLLVEWREFDDFALRVERSNGQPMMTFRLHDELRTIAEFWSPPEALHAHFSRQEEIDLLRVNLIESARRGYIWWGTVFPIEDTVSTSFIRWFPDGFPLPDQIKAALNTQVPQTPLESEVELI